MKFKRISILVKFFFAAVPFIFLLPWAADASVHGKHFVKVAFYAGLNMSGAHFGCLQSGSYTHYSRPWNRSISSIWVAEGFKVILEDHSAFRGKKIVLFSDGHCKIIPSSKRLSPRIIQRRAYSIHKGRKGCYYNLSELGWGTDLKTYKVEQIKYRYVPEKHYIKKTHRNNRRKPIRNYNRNHHRFRK